MPEPKSVLDQIRFFEEKAQQLREERKTEILADIEKAIGELGELGFPYALQEASKTPNLPLGQAKAPKAGKTPAKPKVTGASANFNPDKTCPVCGSIKGHDGRAHRVHKEAFTAEELAQLGLQAPQADAATA